MNGLLCQKMLDDLVGTELGDLAEELRECRPDRVSPLTNIPLIAFLVTFFLAGPQEKFLPIAKSEALTHRWLSSKVSDLNGTRFPELLRSLAAVNTEQGVQTAHIENHLHQTLYVALSRLCSHPAKQSRMGAARRSQRRGR